MFKLSTLINSLKKLEKEKREGQRIRAKQQDLLEKERPTKFYLKREQERREDKQITALINDNDEILQQKENILGEIETFYTTLYQSNGINRKQMEENLKHVKRKIKNDEQKHLNNWI